MPTKFIYISGFIVFNVKNSTAKFDGFTVHSCSFRDDHDCDCDLYFSIEDILSVLLWLVLLHFFDNNSKIKKIVLLMFLTNSLIISNKHIFLF